MYKVCIMQVWRHLAYGMQTGASALESPAREKGDQ
jgi:hypothetical protein